MSRPGYPNIEVRKIRSGAWVVWRQGRRPYGRYETWAEAMAAAGELAVATWPWGRYL